MSNTGDYPDFVRTVQAAAPVPFLALPTGLRAAGPVTFGPYYMGEWSAVVVNVLSNRAAQVQLSWFADQALTQPLGSQTIQAPANVPIAECIPALGAWLSPAFTWDLGGVGAFSSAYLAPRLDVHAMARPIGNLVIYKSSGVAIGAGASFTDTAQAFVCSGPAKLTVDGASNTWRALVIGYDFTGFPYGVLGFIDGSASQYGGMADLYLPMTPVSVTLFNTSAVGQTFAYAMVMGNVF